MKSRLVEIPMGGKYSGVKVDPGSLQRLIMRIVACCPFLGEKKIRAMDSPNLAGIEKLPIRPRGRPALVSRGPEEGFVTGPSAGATL